MLLWQYRGLKKKKAERIISFNLFDVIVIMLIKMPGV
jgi:hypothetical protein